MLLQFVKGQSVWSSMQDSLLNPLLQNIWDGRESSTTQKYCLSLRKFLSFLSRKNLPSDLPFSLVTVAEYLTLLKVNNNSKASIDSTMASLKWVHSFIPGINQWNNPMNDDFLSKIMSSSKRRISLSKNQKTPISGPQINQMISSSNLNDLIELRNCVIISLAYSLLLRHDEFSHLALNHFTENENGYKILIPKSKTDKYRNGSHVLLKSCSSSISPFMLLKRYISMAQLKIGENHFLFFPFKKVGINHINQNKMLSYATFRDIVKSFAIKIGLDPVIYGTHSLRSGGATDLAPNISEFELLTSGRWSDSRSIRSYVELSDSHRFEINNILQSAISANNSETSVQQGSCSRG